MLPKKANLGCGEPPLHRQDAMIMGDPENWLWVDKYVDHPNVVRWDVETLEEIPDYYLQEILASHVLEHISHTRVRDVLTLWHRKLETAGVLRIIVPDLVWACKQLIKLEKGQALDGHYYEFWGKHGLLSVFFGTHDRGGEFHHCGFTKSTIAALLLEIGFKDITIEEWYEGHDIGCLYVICHK